MDLDETNRDYRPLLIGIYAPSPGSGKDTVRRILEEDFDYHPRKFAYFIKAMAAELLRLCGYSEWRIDNVIEGAEKERKLEPFGRSMRWILQSLGDEWGRQCIHPDIWVKLTLLSIQQSMITNCRLVFDDMRYPNEYQMVKDAGGEVWRVTRPDVEYSGDHRSEGSLDKFKFDKELYNDGSLQDLRNKVKASL